MSSILEECSKLFEGIAKMHPYHIANVMGVLLAVVAPGYLTVLYFFPKMFFGLDNVKLFFVAISLSLPVLAGIAITLRVLAAPAIEISEQFLLATFFSFISLYGGLLVSWYFKLSFGGFLFFLIMCEIGVVILRYFNNRSVAKAQALAHPPNNHT